MDRFFRPVVFGVFAPFVFILGAELFEVSGSLWFLVPSCALLAFYLATCEFFVGRRERRSQHTLWPTMAAMAVPLLLWFVIILLAEKPKVVVRQGVPMLITGVIAIAMGAFLATQGKNVVPPVHS